MQRYLPLILFVTVALVVLKVCKRERETDGSGNPIIRNWGAFILFLLCAVFWAVTVVRNLGDPFHQRHPENTYVEVAGGVLALVAAFFVFYFRFTLTADNIELRAVPFFKTKLYPLASVIEVPSYKRGWFDIKLKGEGRIRLQSVYSGVPYFLRCLTARIEQRRDDAH